MGDRPGPAEDRALAGAHEDPDRLAIAASSRLGEMLARQRLAGRSEGVELVGLGAIAAGRTGPAVDLDDPLALLQQIRREPGAIAARPSIAQTRRPGACSRAKASTRLAPKASVGIVTSATRPPVGVTTAAVWVCLWVSTPMTASTWSASIAMVALRFGWWPTIGAGLGWTTEQAGL